MPRNVELVRQRLREKLEADEAISATRKKNAPPRKAVPVGQSSSMMNLFSNPFLMKSASKLKGAIEGLSHHLPDAKTTKTWWPVIHELLSEAMEFSWQVMIMLSMLMFVVTAFPTVFVQNYFLPWTLLACALARLAMKNFPDVELPPIILRFLPKYRPFKEVNVNLAWLVDLSTLHFPTMMLINFIVGASLLNPIALRDTNASLLVMWLFSGLVRARLPRKMDSLLTLSMLIPLLTRVCLSYSVSAMWIPAVTVPLFLLGSNTGYMTLVTKTIQHAEGTMWLLTDCLFYLFLYGAQSFWNFDINVLFVLLYGMVWPITFAATPLVQSELKHGQFILGWFGCCLVLFPALSFDFGLILHYAGAHYLLSKGLASPATPAHE